MPKPIFDVDRKGLAKLLEQRGKAFAILELIQNALDERVTNVTVTIARDGNLWCVCVTDDSPDGFKDLSHAYTLYAESDKKKDAEKRGRFNLGEKLVIAIAETTQLITTTGGLRFTREGRHRIRVKRAVGSEVKCWIRMNKEAAEQMMEAARSVLVPPNVTLTVNGAAVPRREPIATFEATLATIIADAEGYLKPTERKTTVSVYEPVHPDDHPHLFELGIPVVALELPWHVSIAQKVPLNTDRDNVTPAYMRRVCVEVLNHMDKARLTADVVAQPWVAHALESPLAKPEAINHVLDGRYGKNRVTRDPHDPEATRLAMSQGFAIVEGGAFSGAAWANIRRAEAVKPAGQVTPSPKVEFSEDGDPNAILPESEWTLEMHEAVARCRLLSKALHGVELDVGIYRWFGTGQERRAAYSKVIGVNPNKPQGHLSLNRKRLSLAWFKAIAEGPANDAFWKELELLIHEFGHQYGDHLDHAYHQGLVMLAAKAAELAWVKDDAFTLNRASLVEEL